MKISHYAAAFAALAMVTSCASKGSDDAATAKEETKTVTGEVSYIVEGSSLYNTYGPGCLYTFYETTAEGKREVTWELPGGKLSYITLTIQSTGDISGITGVLQPLILADTIGN